MGEEGRREGISHVPSVVTMTSWEQSTITLDVLFSKLGFPVSLSLNREGETGQVFNVSSESLILPSHIKI